MLKIMTKRPPIFGVQLRVEMRDFIMAVNCDKQA